jgi:hypothetical protein
VRGVTYQLRLAKSLNTKSRAPSFGPQLVGAFDRLLRGKSPRAKYVPAVRTDSVMPHSCSIGLTTAARFHSAKSIFNYSGRFSQMSSLSVRLGEQKATLVQTQLCRVDSAGERRDGDKHQANFSAHRYRRKKEGFTPRYLLNLTTATVSKSSNRPWDNIESGRVGQYSTGAENSPWLSGSAGAARAPRILRFTLLSASP